MEKAIVFTDEQKSLIWRTKVQPKNGTGDDALMFMEVCEQYGLNPLLNDIVFNRYESKSGPVVNFIVTRDAYLKVAMRDPNYVKVMGNVVKEGDHFEMNTVDGSIEHRFGLKRGNILGAWAIAEHKSRGKLPVFVDFDENWRANAASQKGRNAVWDDRPSAMILKVAEVYALRRQFPLGGVVAAEEIGLNDLEVAELDNSPIQDPQTEPLKEEKKPTKSEKPKTPTKPKKEEKQPTKQEVSEKQKEELKAQSTSEQVETQNEETTEQQLSENSPVEKEKTSEEIPFKAYTVIAFRDGVTPQGTKFSKVAVQDETGKKLVAYARGEILEQLDEVQEGQSCLFHIESVNGYDNLIAVGALA